MAEQRGPAAVERLRHDYRPALLAHLARHDEATLQSAYDLGRQAMAGGVSSLDLVQVHHAVLYDEVSQVREVDEVPDMLEAAAAFLVEALAPFEMTRPQLG